MTNDTACSGGLKEKCQVFFSHREVKTVNTRKRHISTKNGPKSAMIFDCQYLWKLSSYDLLLMVLVGAGTIAHLFLQIVSVIVKTISTCFHAVFPRLYWVVLTTLPVTTSDLVRAFIIAGVIIMIVVVMIFTTVIFYLFRRFFLSIRNV